MSNRINTVVRALFVSILHLFYKRIYLSSFSMPPSFDTTELRWLEREHFKAWKGGLHQTKIFDCYAFITCLMEVIDNRVSLNDKNKRLYILQLAAQSDEKGFFSSDRSLDTNVLSPKVTSRWMLEGIDDLQSLIRKDFLMWLVRSLQKLAAGYFIENCNRVFYFTCGPGSGPKSALANMGSRYPITFFCTCRIMD